MKNREVSSQVAADLATISHNARHLMLCLNNAGHYYKLIFDAAEGMEREVGDKSCKTCGQLHPDWGQYKNVPETLFQETLDELSKANNAYNNFYNVVDGLFGGKIANLKSLINRLEFQK